MGHGCQRIKSRNYIVTSSLLSLQPFAKMKIISFSLESRPNLYLPLYCLVQYHPFKSILSFSKCMSRTNEAFRGHSGPRTEFLRYLDSLPGNIPLNTLEATSVCATPKDMVFALFRSKNWYTLCSFWFGIGYDFRLKKRRIRTYLSFQFQINE